MAKRKSPKIPPMAGLTVLLLVGVAAALPFADLSCSARPPMGEQTQAMELRGRWLGMELAAAGSPSAVNAGVPPQVSGVVVMQLSPQSAPRATQAGIALGDVIVRVDGTPVTTLAELYTLTTKLDVARPLAIDISRGGQALSLTLPPPVGMPPSGAANVAAVQPGIAPQSNGAPLPMTTPGLGEPPASAQIGQNPQPMAQSAAWQPPMGAPPTGAFAQTPSAPAPAAW